MNVIIKYLDGIKVISKYLAAKLVDIIIKYLDGIKALSKYLAAKLVDIIIKYLDGMKVTCGLFFFCLRKII